jgi:outer membrane protein OmpA-like peptidoglycan-associated protein/tetratricopeptide (TPR) repeat protein
MYKNISFSVLIVFFTLNALWSQNSEVQLKGTKPEKYYKKALEYFNKKNFPKAKDNFERTIQLKPDYIRPYLYLASIYYETFDYNNCEQYYKKALAIDSAFNVEIYFSLAIVLEKEKKFEESLFYYKKFLQNPSNNPGLIRKANSNARHIEFINRIIREPVAFNPIPLNSNINTSDNEYFPVLTGDNEKMIFTRRTGNQEDFYEADFINGQWTNVVPLSEINTPYNEGANTIAVDGNTMIFTICDRRRTYGSCDLFICKKQNGKWSEIKNLGAVINSEYWDSHPSLSHDGKILYFSSDRPGGNGGKDIWVSHLSEQGDWTKPECLDTSINTSADDFTPFIHADNQTLYFTSTGHQGLGSSDLFMSKKVNDKWSTAINLGYPINTEDHEGGIFITLDGKTAYFFTDRFEKTGKNLDIYYFDVPENIKPEPVSFVKGFVYDLLSGEILDAEINISDNNTSVLINTLKTDKDSFLIALPGGVDYNFTIQKENYIFHSERFVLPENLSRFKPFYVKIGLQKIATDTLRSQPVILNNIFFESNSSVLDTVKSVLELKNLLKLLQRNPGLCIRINGHSDDSGTEDYNMKLSESRAKAVYNYLIINKIQEKRISFKGFGETKPVTSNATEEGRQKNRRTEFEIVK